MHIIIVLLNQIQIQEIVRKLKMVKLKKHVFKNLNKEAASLLVFMEISVKEKL